MGRAVAAMKDTATYRVVGVEKFIVSPVSFIYHYPVHTLFDGGTGPQGLARCRAFWESSVKAASSARNTRFGRKFRLEIAEECPATYGPISAFRYSDTLPE